ncbi:MAG: YbhN family protein [Oscillospiraceae bacterium]
MKKKITYALNVLVIVLIAFLTVRLLFGDNGFHVFVHDFSRAKKGWLWLGIALVLLFVCSESVIIKYMLKMFGTKLPLLRCIKYSFIGFFFSYITPSASGGQPAQVFYMKKDGVNVGYSTLIMVVIAFTYKLVLVLLGLIFLLLRFTQLRGYIGGLAWLVVVGFILNAAYIFLLAMVIVKPSWIRKIGIKLINLLAFVKIIRNEEKYIAKINRVCDNYSQCADYIKNNILVVVKIMLITAVQRVFLFAVTYVVYKAYGLSGTPFIDIVAVQTLIAVAVEMLPLPGAAGVTEGCFISMFEPIFGGHLVKSALLLSRGMSFYILLIIGAFVTAGAHFIVVKRNMKN